MSIFKPHDLSAKPLSGLPYGYWPVVHTFGVDNYRVLSNPTRETWSKYWWNDSPTDPNWPVFVEGVMIPKNQAPRGWQTTGGIIDRFPRTVYYGGPISRLMSDQYRKIFENWAAGQGMAYETAIIPVQPNASGMRHPNTNFVWYIANESMPQTRYRYVRNYGTNNFRWVDLGIDTWKYANFHRQNPRVV